MAEELGLPEEIRNAQPTTDTYTLPQGQDEFFFALPYARMDLALWSLDHGVSAAALAAALETGELEAQRIYDDIAAKRRAARYQHAPAETIERLGVVADS
jgi:NAD+ synthase